MCYSCDRLKNRVGYNGQKYAVYFTRDGEEQLMGWQNEAVGGLEKAAKLMPGVTGTRIAEVASIEAAERANFDFAGRCSMKNGSSAGLPLDSAHATAETSTSAGPV